MTVRGNSAAAMHQNALHEVFHRGAAKKRTGKSLTLTCRILWISIGLSPSWRRRNLRKRRKRWQVCSVETFLGTLSCVVSVERKDCCLHSIFTIISTGISGFQSMCEDLEAALPPQGKVPTVCEHACVFFFPHADIYFQMCLYVHMHAICFCLCVRM